MSKRLIHYDSHLEYYILYYIKLLTRFAKTASKLAMNAKCSLKTMIDYASFMV